MKVYIHQTKETREVTKQEALDLLHQYTDKQVLFLKKVVGYSSYFVLMNDKGKEIKARPKITIDWKID